MITSNQIAACALIFIFVAAACSAERVPPADEITVTGTVTVRGNEPFTAYVLETAQRNAYVLRFDDVEPPSTPASIRATGRLYADEWAGRAYAHIDVRAFEAVP